MIELIAPFLIFGGFVLFCVCSFVSFTRGQNRCDRLNAANDLAREYWRALTPDDREWLLENGASKPSLGKWGMR